MKGKIITGYIFDEQLIILESGSSPNAMMVVLSGFFALLIVCLISQSSFMKD